MNNSQYEAPMEQGARERFWSKIAKIATASPRLVLAVTAVLVVLALVSLPSLRVSTSRRGLVEESNPYQQRLLQFFERFGDPNSPVFFVISGSTPTDRRHIVDELVTEFEKRPDLKGRVIARVGPEHIAEILLLQDPEATRELRALAPSEMKLADFIEGGLPQFVEAMESRLANLAAALQMRMMVPFGATVSSHRVNGILDRLASLAKTTDAYLAGESPWKHFEIGPKYDDSSRVATVVDSAGYVVGKGNEYLLVTVFPDFKGDEVDDYKPAVDYLRSVRDGVLGRYPDSSVKVRLTGIPTIAVDELGIVNKGLMQSGLAAGLGIFLLLLISFRSLRQSILATIPLVIGTLVTLGFVRYTFGKLNLITSSFISVLLGLGIDFPVHLLSRYNEFRRDSHDILPALKNSLTRTGPGILTGALTTVLAFLTTTTTEFTAFAELGIITAVGILIMLLATVFVVPTLTSRLQRSRELHSGELPGLELIAFYVRRSPQVIFIIGIIAAGCGAMQLNKIQFNYRYFDFLPQETESAQALLMLEDDLAMGPTFANLSVVGIEKTRKIVKQLRQLPTVATVQTATDLLPPLTAKNVGALEDFFNDFEREPNFDKMSRVKMGADALIHRIEGMIAHINTMENIYRLMGESTESTAKAKQGLSGLILRLQAMGDKALSPLLAASAATADIMKRAWDTARGVFERKNYTTDDIPEILHRRFVSKDKEALAVFVYPRGNIWDRSFAGRFAQDLESIDPNVSGFAITLHAHSQMILKGFERASIIAGFLICVLLFLDFRSFEKTMLALTPTLIGWMWMIGIFALMDIDFNVANIVVLPLVLGIGIDAGVHMVHRFEESAAEHQGVARVRDLVRGTGTAILLSGITTMVGFGGLILADYGGMKSLGIAMVVGVASCLLACLLVLPAILVLMGRAK